MDMSDYRSMVAQCWCVETTKHLVMEPALAEVFARLLGNWIETAAQAYRNVEYYQGLLDQCAQSIGVEAYTADDGIVHPEPLRIKVPELVAKLCEERTSHD